ncbi:MAG: L-asparaginase 2 [Paracidovorax wautersii]|uniref:L-asparaginase 2 n=1 Tax=Paracidovorax wautersii TaxID=1177982 RepID=A0A7V8FMT1_9BURK|nr:MAG: L-asparaginase 2 [Paracidovorax wautersii]
MTLSAAPTDSRALPGVALFATGGTIAGSSASKTDTTDYLPGAIGIADLLAAVPELAGVARISGEQVANVASSDVDQAILLRLARALHEKLADPAIAGAVVTHGTDMLAESAFFIELTVRSPKPVVFVGAMRPATAISADGPMNLLNAVTLAASPAAAGRGTLIALNDRIGSAFYTQKTNSTALDTFRADEQGALGLFLSGQPRFYYEPAAPLGRPFFDIAGIEALPLVPILYAHQDMGPALIDAAIAGGARGLVIAGSGNGTLPEPVKQRVAQLDGEGFVVVRASRAANGFVTPKKEGIAAGIYSASKARWLLALALATGATREQIRQYFSA